MTFEIKLLAATEVPFSSSMTNCSTSAASWRELKLNGSRQDTEILQMRAHKKFDGLTGLLYLSFVFRFRVDKDDDSDSTLLQNDGKTLSACRMVFLCVCVCVCVCVFIVFHCKRFFCLQQCLGHTWGVSINNLVLWVLYQVLLPSSFISISKCHISYPKMKLRQPTNWRENDIIYCPCKKIIYIDIGYKSASVGLNPKPTSTKKILKIRRLLWSKFFHFKLSPWH